MARLYAPRLNLLDRPAGRKQHIGDIPTVGGLSIFLAFLFGTTAQFDLCKSYAVLLGGMGFMVIVGALDDALDLSATKKLAAQLMAAALIVLASGLPLFTLGHLPVPDQWAMLISVGATIFTILWTVNAVNMMDGVDGLAGGLVVVSLTWLGVGAALTDSAAMLTIIVRLVVPVVAFLVFNHRAPWRKRASVFMGDAGTLMLGYAIAWLCLELRGQGIPMLACTLVVAVPLIDTASLFFRRAYAGKSPFQGDRQHLHHLLEAAGVPTAAVPILINGAAAILGGLGVLGGYFGLSSAFFAVSWLMVVAGHTILIGFLLHRTAPAAGATSNARTGS